MTYMSVWCCGSPYGERTDATPATKEWAAKMIEIMFAIPRNLWVSMNRTTKNHGHTARVRRDIQQVAGFKLRQHRVQPFDGQVAVTWTVHYPKGVSFHHGDPVNASPITKPILDAAVDLGIIKGDGPSIVTSETFKRGGNLARKDSPHQIMLEIKEIE